MRKLILSLAAVFCVLTVSAQTEKWSVGGRVGSGLEAVGQYHLGTVAGKPFYIEGRFGMSWTDRMTRTINDPFWGSYRVTGKANAAGLTANFTVLALSPSNSPVKSYGPLCRAKKSDDTCKAFNVFPNVSAIIS